MRQAQQVASLSPNVLANAMNYAVTGMRLPPLKSVSKNGAANKVTDPESSEVVEDDRISSASEKVEALPCATDQQRLDAWFKLHCPARNVPTKQRLRTVEQLTHDGELVTIKIRQRVGGNLPMRTVAIGSGRSTAKVQMLTPEVIAERQARSASNRANGAGIASGVRMYVSPLADKEVLDQFIIDVEARRRMDRETLMACMIHSRKRHHEWQLESGGSTVRERLYGSAPVVEDKAANDSNIEQFRKEEVNGVPIGTAHPSNNKFKMINANSTVEAQQKSAQYASLDRSPHAYKHVTSATVCHMNTAALHHISAIDNAEGHRYLAWLESRELNNPIIDSSRIKHGEWLDHMSVVHCSEQVKLMSRLNNASNYRKEKLADKLRGSTIAKAVQVHKKYLELQKKHNFYVAQFVGPVREQPTSVPLIKQSSNYNEVFTLVTPTAEELALYGGYATPVRQTLAEAINTNHLFVEIGGVKVHVNKETMLKALLVA